MRIFLFLVLFFIFCSCTSTRIIPTVVEDSKGFLFWDILKLRQIDNYDFPTDTTFTVWIWKSKNIYEKNNNYWLTK